MVLVTIVTSLYIMCPSDQCDHVPPETIVTRSLETRAQVTSGA